MNPNPEHDEYLEQVRGRVKKSTTFGSADTVVGKGNPMRPDRNYDTLWYFSVFGGLLGLDHFYLRNPFSGLLKGLTFGGFLVWWLWDMFQVMTEKERIVLYGLSAPFDIKTGFGQGTISREASNYTQRSDSAWWMIAAVFSFLGADALLMGNWAEFLRKLTEGIIFCVLVWSLTTTWVENGMSGLATFGNVFKILLTILFGLIVVSGWLTVIVPTFVKPESLMKDGIQISNKMNQILNFPAAWIKNITVFGDKIPDRVMKDIGYASISAADMKDSFRVRFVQPGETEEETAKRDAEWKRQQEEDSKTDGLKWHWVLSYLMYLYGPFVLMFQGLKKLVEYIGKAIYVSTPWGTAATTALAAKEAIQVGAKLASGEGIAETIAEHLPGGEKLKDVMDTVKQAGNAAEAATAPFSRIVHEVANVVPSAPPAEFLKGAMGAAAGAIPSAPPAELFNRAMGAAAAAHPAAEFLKGAINTARQVSAAQPKPANANGDPTNTNMGVSNGDPMNNNGDPKPYRQSGGAHHEEPSTQGMILGASVFALAGGAAIKLAVDYLLPSQ